MKPTFFQKHPLLKDILSLAGFVVVIVLGTLFLNTYIYRSYNVVGSSMENTLENDDRVIVNRAAVSWSHFTGNEYIPERGQIIVFMNEDEEAVRAYQSQGVEHPVTCTVPSNVKDQYIIKRVIAFPGERVTVKDGVLKVYQWDEEKNDWNEGTVYDDVWRTSDNEGPKKNTSGEVDTVVPAGELFVSGDNREGSNSWDSRNGLGTVPFCRIVGPVVLRLYPFDSIRTF